MLLDFLPEGHLLHSALSPAVALSLATALAALAAALALHHLDFRRGGLDV